MRVLISTAALGAVAIAGLLPTEGRTRPTSGSSGQQAAVIAERPSKPRTEHPPPPPLPQGADAIEPMTFEVTTGAAPGGPAPGATQVMMRTSDRLLIVMTDAKREWLFERNPVDTRRVSARLVDHARKEIVTFSESELLSMHKVRGWADVLGMVPAAGKARSTPGVDASRLGDPRTRFPGYKALDASDVGEHRH